MVEWKKLGEVVELARGVRVVKTDLATEGMIPVFQNSLSPLGYYDIHNYPAGTTFVISAGAAGDIGFSDMPFWAADDCLGVTCPNDTLNKFVFYFLQTKQSILKSQVRKASVPRLSRTVVEKLDFPCIPISEQSRIVGILDTFTASIANLKEQIGERRKQYEHYRDQLLDLEGKEGVEMKTLGEVVGLARGVRVVKNDLTMEGVIPVFQNSISPLGYYDIHNYPAGTTFVISAGAAGDIGFSDIPFWAADDCLGVTCPDGILNKFVFYFLQTKQTILKSQVRKASVPRLSRIVVERLGFPYISLSEQSRIVSILDQFEASIANLEAQLQEREKQYEHYREKLLTFE